MDEIKERLFAAKSAEEVVQVLKDAGDDEAKAERVWQEICYQREQEGRSLSLDELDAVAGGGKRDWIKYGCNATVEPDSNCLGTDGGCMFVNVNYDQNVANVPCPFCGARYTAEYINVSIKACGEFFYRCRECGRYSYYNLETGTWEEC